MESKIISRKKMKRLFIILTAIWILLSIFFHLIYSIRDSASYWPIYFIVGIGILVVILCIRVFIDEFSTIKESKLQLSKQTRYLPPNKSSDPLDSKLHIDRSQIQKISFDESDFV